MKDLLDRLRGSLFKARCRLAGRRVSIGSGLRLRIRLDIRGEGSVVIGDDCVMEGIPGDSAQFVTLYAHRRGSVVTIGDRVRLRAARISSAFAVTVGDDSLIEESGIADTDFHALDRDRGVPQGETLESCRVVIGKRVAVGPWSIIAKGVTVGDDAVVGPAAVVTRAVPPGSFVLGNPAKVVTSGGERGSRP